MSRPPEPFDGCSAALVGEPLLEDRAAQCVAGRRVIQLGDLDSNDAHQIELPSPDPAGRAFQRTSEFARRGGKDHVGVSGRKIAATYHFQRSMRQRHEPAGGKFRFHDVIELPPAPHFRHELLGVVAPTESTMTVVPYEPGVAGLRFPLTMGTTWMADSVTRGAQVEGTTVASRDRYTFTVDARGTVILPEIRFTDALRLRIELTQQFAAGPGVRKIQYLWLVECYGEVARMTSRDGEVDPDFASAVEFRRLGIGL